MDQTGMNEDRVNDDLRARMSEADAAQWDEIQQWKASQLSDKRPRAITQKMKSAALAPVGKAVSIARKVPGGEALTRTMSSAALGLVELAASASEASVRRTRILKAYRAAGHDVTSLRDIRSLPLDQVLAVKPRLSLAYSGTAAAEGAVSGVFASGGSLAAVLGMGVASAPGVGVTASAMAVDITTFLAAATRLVAHTAAYYGYDSEDPSERLFSTMVLSQAIDPAGSGRDFVVEKQATMLAFNQVMRDLARKGSLESLGGSAIVSAMKSLFSAMGVRLASRKLAQIVPVAGIVVSAGLNAALMRTIGETADHLYRERFLAERYGHVQASGTSTDLVPSTGPQELSVDVARYVELAEAESHPYRSGSPTPSVTWASFFVTVVGLGYDGSAGGREQHARRYSAAHD